MHVELRLVDSIRRYESNPRLNDSAVDAVARSITEFGWRQHERLDRVLEVVELARRSAVLDVARLGEAEVPQDQLVDGEAVDRVRARRALARCHQPAGGKPFGNDTAVLGLTLGGAVLAEVDVLAVDTDDAKASSFVQAVLRDARWRGRLHGRLQGRKVVATTFRAL